MTIGYRQKILYENSLYATRMSGTVITSLCISSRFVTQHCSTCTDSRVVEQVLHVSQVAVIEVNFTPTNGDLFSRDFVIAHHIQ